MKKSVKISAITFLFFALAIALAIGGCIYIFGQPFPPKEAKLIQKFNENRASFEQLREMLQADPNLSRFEEYSPPEKIKKYQSLLKIVGVPSGWTSGRGTNTEVFFMVWGWGIAGEAEHLDICWLNQKPTNQIATLEGYRGWRYPNRVVVYRHLDQQWYLSADW